MFVRIEKTSNPNIVIVIDEIDRCFGTIYQGVFFKHCITNKELTEIDDELYYTVSKEKVLKYCEPL